jgi:hypothetical protein
MEHIKLTSYNNLFKILLIIIVFYLLYSLINLTSTTVTYIEQINVDSPYFTPEGWPSPFPYK